MMFPFPAVDAIAREESRWADWLGTIPTREDVYDVLAETAEAAVPGQAQAILTGELAEEREQLFNIAEVVARLAGEARKLETPVFDAVVAELETHGIV
jgi:pyridoxal/pyridoxine/pyridoxamine kinase